MTDRAHAGAHAGRHAAPSTDRPVLVVAHRGASGVAPENTIPAIEAAIEQGADLIEVDLQLTADGEVVLFHDVTLGRTTDVEQLVPDRSPWEIGGFTLEELRGLDAGSWFESAFAGTSIPTLREALEVMAGRIGLWLELKSPHLHPGLEKAVADILRTTPGGWLSEPGACVATGFDAESIRRFAVETDHAVPIGLIGKDVPPDEDLRAIARPAGIATYFIPDARRLGPGELTRIRAAGLHAGFWTPNDPLLLGALALQGAASVISNYPDLAREVVEGCYRPPATGPVIERLDGAGSTWTAILRNLGQEPVQLAGWHLRGDPADRLWTGTDEEIPAGSALVVRLPAEPGRTDSAVALHRPDGRVVDLTA